MFDLQAFERAEFKPRTERCDVDSLAAFFPKGEKPEWEVRGLTAVELCKCLEAEQRQQGLKAIMELAAAATSGGAEQLKQLREAAGMLHNATPAEVAKRLEMLVMASVSPKIEMATAVKLAENFSVDFWHLTQTILRLSGQGAEATDLGKPAAASQPTPA